MARLDGMGRVLPNPDLFIAMYVKKEALLSTQIEGTQASLRGVLEVEASLETGEDLNEIGEVINYIDAMRYGLETVRNEPISIALIREIHWLLLRSTRGADRFPVEIRRDQNYLGPPRRDLHPRRRLPPATPGGGRVETVVRGRAPGRDDDHGSSRRQSSPARVSRSSTNRPTRPAISPSARAR